MTKISKMTQVSKVPKIDKITKITKISEIPEMTKISEIPKMTKVSKVPKSNKIPKITIISEIPKMTKISKNTKMNKILNWRTKIRYLAHCALFESLSDFDECKKFNSSQEHFFQTPFKHVNEFGKIPKLLKPQKKIQWVYCNAMKKRLF